jgi:hypothetical protein
MNISPEKNIMTLSRASAKRALARVRLIDAGFEITHLTHTVGEMMDDDRLDAWHIEGDIWVKLLASMGFEKGPFNTLVDIQAFHKVAFQYGRRFFLN